jgi:isopentenyl-diphosphate Delta-isomerase
MPEGKSAAKRPRVVLVDTAGNVTGEADKLEAHRDGGRLHLAFSVFVFDTEGRVLLQRRAPGKYHFAGRWTNTCCSHPMPGEGVVEAGVRRLDEEMGITTSLTDVGSFIYRAEDAASGLTEYELDHVLIGEYDDDPVPNPDEADAWRWVTLADLHSDLTTNPNRYTPWLAPALRLVQEA